MYIFLCIKRAEPKKGEHFIWLVVVLAASGVEAEASYPWV